MKDQQLVTKEDKRVNLRNASSKILIKLWSNCMIRASIQEILERLGKLRIGVFRKYQTSADEDWHRYSDSKRI